MGGKVSRDRRHEGEVREMVVDLADKERRGGFAAETASEIHIAAGVEILQLVDAVLVDLDAELEAVLAADPGRVADDVAARNDVTRRYAGIGAEITRDAETRIGAQGGCGDGASVAHVEADFAE